MKAYYDEIVNATGLVNDVEKEVSDENKQAKENEEEYHKLLEAEELGNTEEVKEPAAINNKNLKLYALSALLMDASNNRVLYEENGDKKLPMASTTKIMTCIVTLENADLNGIVTVSSYAASMPDVQLNIRKGEQYYLKDLLYSLMLESHNDVAVAIAEYVGGSVEGFATMMNDKAKALDCLNTNFVTPNGLDAESHYTTAKDLATIASYAIKNEDFIKITNTPSHSFKEIKNARSFTVTNKNRFLYMMDGAIGVKTGFTNGAGYCFVGAVKKSDRELVSVVLGSGWPPHKHYKWSDTKELMSYGVDNFEIKKIFEEKEFDPVFVQDGQSRYENLNIKGDNDLTMLIGKNETVKIVYRVPKKLLAPVKAGSLVGSAKYYINDIPYKEIPIYTTSDIKKIDYAFCLNEVFKIWCGQY
jgi:D-alanyl-D-alanine carboxypeptidase (penicillin-binding protein 5/6)